MVINYTRGIVDNTLNGHDPDRNYKLQSEIAAKMHTDGEGTTGAGVVDGLVAFAKYPSGFFYQYKGPSNGSEFHGWIVTDIAGYKMPLIPSLIPHNDNQAGTYHLENWTHIMTIPHFVVIRGYNGFWDGTNTPKVYYEDSASPLGAGRYSTGALTMWKVTSYFVGKVVW